MRITRIFMIVALVVTGVLGAAATVGAQETYVSGITIQNQSTTDTANITVIFYWAMGTPNAGQVAYQFDDTIPANEANTYYIPDLVGVPDGFVGGAVVTSDQPVAANINTQTPVATSGTMENPSRGGTAIGVLDPALTLYAPDLVKDFYGWNSYLAVQNTDDTQASVNATFYDAATGAVVHTETALAISAFSTYIIRLENITGIPAGFKGSCVVQSTGSEELAGLANVYAPGSSPETATFLSYNTFGSGAMKVYLPRVLRLFYGYNSGVTVQNVGTGPTNVTLTYFFGGSQYVQTVNGLAAGASTVQYLPDVTELTGITNASGSAVVTSSSENIVATVNSDNRTDGRGITYNGVLEGQPTDTVLISQVAARFYGYSGGFQVQNVGTGTATVTVVLSAQGHPAIPPVVVSINANESAEWFAPDVPGVNPGFNGSVVITADQNIVAIANNSHRQDVVPADSWPMNYGDSYLAYNGINK